MCCSHVPARSTSRRRNASWWLATAVSTARTSSTLTPWRRAAGSAGPASGRPRATRVRGSARCSAEPAGCAVGARWFRQAAGRVLRHRRRPPGRPRSGARRDPAGVTSRPALVAVVAMPIAIRESPPRSKKLAFRSIELDAQALRPDAPQRRLGLRLPVADTSAVDGCAVGATRRHEVVASAGRSVQHGGLRVDPMPLARKGITGQRRRCAAESGARGVQSTVTPADHSWPSPSRKASRSSVFCIGWRMSRTARCPPDHFGCRIAEPVRLPPGPTSTRIRSGSLSTTSSSSANLIVELIWRAQLAGSVACSSVIQVPVRLLSSGVSAERAAADADRNSSNSAHHGIHRAGMERVGGADPPRGDPVLAQALGERADRVLRPGDHAVARIVDRGQLDAG